MGRAKGSTMPPRSPGGRGNASRVRKDGSASARLLFPLGGGIRLERQRVYGLAHNVAERSINRLVAFHHRFAFESVGHDDALEVVVVAHGTGEVDLITVEGALQNAAKFLDGHHEWSLADWMRVRVSGFEPAG